MKHPEKADFYALVISTLCVIFIDFANLLDYLDTGNPGGTVSNLCFLAASLCIVYAWIRFFQNRNM
ncbi:MAG: hypothetical protein IJN67_10060 [Oscillospiraceae bacterium]|nr:hypothetical protein [Oscillospiraceae bacterium]